MNKPCIKLKILWGNYELCKYFYLKKIILVRYDNCRGAIILAFQFTLLVTTRFYIDHHIYKHLTTARPGKRDHQSLNQDASTIFPEKCGNTWSAFLFVLMWQLYVAEVSISALRYQTKGSSR